MRFLVFSILVFFIPTMLFSETLTSTEVDAIVKTDRVRANTEKAIIIAAGQLATSAAPSRAEYWINFMRAYAWVMNDMNTGSFSVYKLGTYWRNLLRSSGVPMDTTMVTGALLSMIMGSYEESGEDGVIQMIMIFNFADARADNIEDENDPVWVAWMAQARETYNKIITLANQLTF